MASDHINMRRTIEEMLITKQFLDPSDDQSTKNYLYIFCSAECRTANSIGALCTTIVVFPTMMVNGGQELLVTRIRPNIFLCIQPNIRNVYSLEQL